MLTRRESGSGRRGGRCSREEGAVAADELVVGLGGFFLDGLEEGADGLAPDVFPGDGDGGDFGIGQAADALVGHADHGELFGDLNLEFVGDLQCAGGDGIIGAKNGGGFMVDGEEGSGLLAGFFDVPIGTEDGAVVGFEWMIFDAVEESFGAFAAGFGDCVTGEVGDAAVSESGQVFHELGDATVVIRLDAYMWKGEGAIGTGDGDIVAFGGGLEEGVGLGGGVDVTAKEAFNAGAEEGFKGLLFLGGTLDGFNTEGVGAVFNSVKGTDHDSGTPTLGERATQNSDGHAAPVFHAEGVFVWEVAHFIGAGAHAFGGFFGNAEFFVSIVEDGRNSHPREFEFGGDIPDTYHPYKANV